MRPSLGGRTHGRSRQDSRRSRRYAAGPSPSRWSSRPRTTLLVGTRRRGARDAPPRQRPKPGGEITYGLEAETGGGWCPTSGPPRHLRHRGGAAIYDTLVVPNTKNEMVPVPRRSRSSPTPTSPQWTITLRDGITFHDGTPLTADAVKQNFEA